MADTASLVVRVRADGVDSADRSLDSLSSTSKKTERSIASLTSSAGDMAAGFIAGAGAISALSLAVKASISANRQFEKSLSDLSAITGSTGDQLEYLKAQAAEIGATTSLSASEASEAFKLIASAKPDLLESSAALNSVTRAAVTLAEAAGTTLPDAANTLGSALNQFSADADEATRYINVLAAGSKFGAAEVAEVAESLKVSGVSAASASVSFEELNASIQSLSMVSIKGSEAGTALRNIILKLETDVNQKLKPSVNGLNGALKNLAEMNESATELTKRFGLENVNAAQALLQNVDALDDLTSSLTGTNTAYEQASTRTNNLDGDLKSLSSAAEGLSLVIGEKLNPSARSATKFLTELSAAAAMTIDAMGGAPTTIDGVALALSNVNDRIKELEGMEKRYGATSILDAILGNTTDKEAELKSLREEAERLQNQYVLLSGIGSPEKKTQVKDPEVKKELAKQEPESISKAEKRRAEAAAKREVAEKEQAKRYLDQLAQDNMTELELIKAKEVAKIATVAGYREKGLIGEKEQQAAITEIHRTALDERVALEEAAMKRLDDANQKLFDEQIRAQKEKEDARQKTIDDGIGAQRSMTGDLKSVLGEQNALYKASAIVTATIQTYQAATGAMAAMSAIPVVGPALGIAAAGAAIAAGMAQVAAISGAREQGGYMSAGSAYQMAERGKAEVIVPAGNSRAKTMGQMKEMMGDGNSGASSIVIVNQTTGRIDSVEQEQDSEGRMILTIKELLVSETYDQSSGFAKARRDTRGQPGY
jgi:TP901 family phage tail tape measure protein